VNPSDNLCSAVGITVSLYVGSLPDSFISLFQPSRNYQHCVHKVIRWLQAKQPIAGVEGRYVRREVLPPLKTYSQFIASNSPDSSK
jgi:hypothetical protein